MYAAIRLRGNIGLSHEDHKTLASLRLTRANHCVLLKEDKTNEGMLKRVGQYITFGKINEATLNLLVAKRGRLPGDKRIAKADAQKMAKDLFKGNLDVPIKRVFRLSPPSKGLRSARKFFPQGDLGNRGEKINELLERMV
ncbi:MAG: uL30 family ribosomal protein [Candidatus Aenigmarchaeota archaeon]|nr:uL30 family ribosomal protein [Candidatus Aenigmarchaeota archaeon]